MVGPKNAAFAEESAEVEVLLASLDRTKDLTKRIKSSLVRLDNSGSIVKDAIGPIYSGTQQLQTTSRNIDRVNEAISKLRKPLDAKGRNEDVIRHGPNKDNLQEYLSALRRLDNALTDLNTSNIRSNQDAIAEFHHLMTTGVDKLTDLYRTAVDEDSHKIEPLHYFTKDLSFPVFESKKAAHLGQIAGAMVAASAQSRRLGRQDEDLAVKIYAQKRGDYISASLESLAIACISTSKRRTGDSSIYKQGQNGIGTYAKSLEGMLLSEHKNVTKVFPREVAERVFVETSAKVIARFSKVLADLNTTIKAQIMTDCFLAYEILEIVTPMTYRIESRTGQLRSQFSDAVRPVRDTARSSLGEILNRTRSQGETLVVLPPDGSTVPLVQDTATRLGVLASFDKPLSSLLTSIGENGWRKNASSLSVNSANLNLDLSSSNNPNSSSISLLTNYLTDIVDTLLSNLLTRSQAIHRANKPVQGIFMLNTIAVLNRSISSQPELSKYLHPPLQQTSPKIDAAYRKPSQAAYLAAWREPSAHLFDQIQTTSSSHRPISGSALDSTSIIKSLSSKDKDKIKEKFKNFNTSFDELVARHKSLTMESEVKVSMSKEISAMLEPLYARFWDRYHEVDKGKGKVVKYSKAELATVLNGL